MTDVIMYSNPINQSVRSDLLKYKECLLEEIKEQCEYTGEYMSPNSIDIMHRLLSTVRKIDEICKPMHINASINHTAEGGTVEQHRSGSTGTTELMEHVNMLHEYAQEYKVEYQEHLEGRNFGADASHMIDCIKGIIASIYDTGNKQSREEIKRMLKDLRGKYVI